MKIHGHRIETGEIEKQLLLMEGIEDCVVLKKEDYISGYLCGYVLSKANLTVSTLREYLALSLPQYMIPARFVVLTEFPLTPHGKVDRKRLPEPESMSLREYEIVMPRNSFEQAIADVWTEVLNVSAIGVNDNFFDLGGDSVKAIRAVLKINERIKATF
ncbi:MAG: phosphopantetheine-binding protein, partial [Flammeovirgaceae bacterium]